MKQGAQGDGTKSRKTVHEDKKGAGTQGIRNDGRNGGQQDDNKKKAHEPALIFDPGQDERVEKIKLLLNGEGPKNIPMQAERRGDLVVENTVPVEGKSEQGQPKSGAENKG